MAINRPQWAGVPEGEYAPRGGERELAAALAALGAGKGAEVRRAVEAAASGYLRALAADRDAPRAADVRGALERIHGEARDLARSLDLLDAASLSRLVDVDPAPLDRGWRGAAVDFGTLAVQLNAIAERARAEAAAIHDRGGRGRNAWRARYGSPTVQLARECARIYAEHAGAAPTRTYGGPFWRLVHATHELATGEPAPDLERPIRAAVLWHRRSAA